MGEITETRWSIARRRLYRIAAILVLCFYGLGSFICFDSIGSLQEVLMHHMEINASQFSLMYSVNTWPNVVLGLVGGVFIDRYFGMKIGAVIFAVITVIGHMIMSFGVVFGIYWLTIFGRLIFGAGMEMNMICLQCYLVMWFKNKEISTVICLVTSVSRVGTSIVFEFSTPLYKEIKNHVSGLEAVGITYFIIGLFGVATVGFGFLMAKMDSKMNNTGKEENRLTERDGPQEQKLELKDILKLPLLYWLIVVEQCALTTIFVFVPFSQGFFVNEYGLTIESANNVTSFFSILGAVIGPFVGLSVDKIGRMVYVLVAGMTMILIGHLLLAFSDVTPYASMAILGVAMVLVISAIIPLISFIVTPNQLATAFGTLMSVYGGFLSINVIVSGVLIDKYGFRAVELYMSSWSLLGPAVGILIWIYDRWNTTDLNLSAKQLKNKQMQAEKDEANINLKSDSPDVDSNRI